MMVKGALEDLRRADREARRRAQEELQMPVAVEAGAGTGKTSVLVARVLAWCLGPGWEEAAERLSRAGEQAGMTEVAAATIEGVVAITFTEKAAAEMEQRVAEALATIRRGEPVVGFDLLPVPDADVSQRAGALLSVLHRFPVSTIHGFASRLLARYPVEAGVAPGFVVDADGLALSEEARAVVEEAAHAGGEDLPEGWRELAASGAGPGSIVEALELLAREGVQPEVLEEDPFSPAVVGELLSGARDACEKLARLVGDLLGSSAADRELGPQIPPVLETLSAELDSQRGGGADGAFVALADCAKGISDKLVNRIREWAKGKFRKKETAAFAGYEGEIQAAASEVARILVLARSTDPALLRAAYRALAPLLETLRERLRSKGIMTYRGLLTGAAALLENAEIAGEVRRGIRQLLVDEFQDTDPVQCDIVLRIALEGPAGERPGLFVVGDPKQSIYGWRSADLAAYEAFLGSMRSAGGTELRLSVNFRSVDPILAEVSRAIRPVMHAEAGFQPTFQPLLPSEGQVAGPSPLGKDRAAIEYWVSWGLDPEHDGHFRESTPVADQREIEAQALAADVRELHDRAGVGWSAIGVLFRTLSAAEPYLEAMRAERIPYAVAKERVYFRRREIVEAAAVVRTILDPADMMALLTVLRSDAVGVPDAALPMLWLEGLPDIATSLDGPDEAAFRKLNELIGRVAGKIPADAPGLDTLPDWPVAVLDAIETLAVLRSSWNNDPAPLFVERLRTLWGAETVAASRRLGRFRLQLLERFFDDLLQVLSETGGRTSEVARFLRRAVADERELEGSPVPAEGDAVQVMTIHGAKGLEFDHVYIMDMTHQASEGSEPRHRVLNGRRGPALRLFGSPSPAYLQAAERARKVARAEQVRLLYVAMTRARCRLVLAGGWPSKPVERTAGTARSLLDLIVHRGARVDPLGAAGSDAGLVRRGEDLLIRFPARERVDRNAPAGRTNVAEEEELIPRDRIKADARHLSAARRDAHAIESRPLTGTPTGLAHADPELEEDEASTHPPGPGDRGAARVVGTAIHRVLERLELNGGGVPDAGEIERLAQAELKRLRGEAPGGSALRRLEQIVEGLGRGTCLARLAEIAPHVVAREMPVLLTPGEGSAVLGFISGAADLVYRDPADGRLVVADYKSDLIPDDETFRRRIAAYSSQVSVYVRALAEAFPSEPFPRAELWFLAEDRIVPVSEEATC